MNLIYSTDEITYNGDRYIRKTIVRNYETTLYTYWDFEWYSIDGIYEQNTKKLENFYQKEKLREIRKKKLKRILK